MSKMNNLSFELNSKTPLSARWAQMTKQEQIIEKKRLEILAKMEAQKKAKTKSGEPKTPATVNKFSNDGSFMDQFKKMSEQNKGGKKPDQVQNKPAESERNEQKDIDRPQGSNNDKHREDTRGRGGEDREDRYRSSSGHRSRDRSRSPRWENRRDKWDRNGRQDHRDNRNRRWESGSRHSRRRSSSPSTPVVEDMMSRKSRYSNPHDRSNSFPPRPSNFPPSNNSPMHCNSPVPPMGNPPNLPPGLPFQPGNNFPHMSNAPPFLDNFNMPGNGPLPPPQNSPFMPNMSPFGNNNPPMQIPMNMPRMNSGPMNFPNSPNPLMPQGLPCPPGQMNMNQNFPQVPPNNSNLPNMGAPPNFNQMMPPNTLPSLMNPNNLSGLNQNLNLPCPPFNPSLGPPNLNQPGLINVQGPSINMPHPMNNLNRGPMNMQGPVGNPNMQCPINMPNMIPPNLQGSMNRPNLQEPNLQLLAPIAYPNIKPQGPFNKNIPPPLNVPLHTIPEPKPLDTLSIPPPKPLDAVKIPPPAPLEAVKIPPPKPMNLQTIPPPLPICLTQIPKPKELDVCSIPPPPSSTVLSPDNPRTSAMEAVASQVARAGDQLEEMLKSQCEQDSSIWFLQDETTADYKMYRELVFKYRNKMHHPNDMKIETEDTRDEDNYKCVPDDEKYEPEFSLQDDSSGEESEDVKCDINKEIKEESNSKEKSEEEWQESEYEDVKRFVKEKSVSGSDSETETDMKKERRERRERKRKSRWGEESSAAAVGNTMIGVPGMANITSLGGVVPFPPTPAVLPLSGEKAQLSRVTRQDPGLLQYALKSYGTTSLSDEDWLKCEDHYKISLLYQEMLRKRHEVEQLAASGRHKYEYDSDEEVDGGTWEHRLRQQEMEATSRWAGELTRAAAGKHHIGDFLPPHELKRFMDKYTAVKGGKEPDLSDYKEFKLKEDNIGFKMLQKLGWSEGEGLGVDKSGIVDPVNKASSRESNQGLGVDRGDNLEEGDDEFDAYRKRMMLAYRFRPNPLNNPRRPYY